MKSTMAVRLGLRSRTPAESEAHAKLRGMMLIRLLLCLIVFPLGPVFFPAYTSPFCMFTGAIFLLTLLYILLLRLDIDPRLSANVQIFADVLLVTLLIGLTGWEHSNFGFLYIIPIASASLFFQLRESVSVALLSSVLYAAMVLLHHYRLSPQPEGSAFEVFYPLYIRTIIFCMVGYLCGHLASLLKKQKERFSELQNLHELILRSMNSGLVTADAGDNIIYANRAGQEIIGFRVEEMYNRKLQDFLADAEGGAVDDVLEQALASPQHGGACKRELLARTASGRKIPIGFTLSAIKDNSGKSAGKVMVFSDLTEVKELERRLRAIDKLRAAGELAAGIAHEIRNPLTSVGGAIEMLAEDPELSETNRQLLSIVLKESARLNKIIADFLSYAKRSSLELKKDNMCDILKSAIDALRREGKLSPGVSIELVTPSEAVMVAADRSQMGQVFLNLLSNAVDAIEGHGSVCVAVEAPSGDSDWYTIRVTDTGRGMSADELARVFEPFFTTKKNGVGIGLCIAEKIVREHNGHLEIMSQLGEGTTVTVLLPASQAVLEGCDVSGRGRGIAPAEGQPSLFASRAGKS